MTVPVGVKNLLDSRKAWFVAALLCVAGVLVLRGKASWDQFLELAKWLGGTFLVGTGLEAVGSGKSPTGGSP